ncbi:HlyD family efflux transporter periplasmic adaptor subunit [Cryobacterium sp. M23]|uniref:HlyD family efflux transporter periplasmic adaptor subunit n=1 Tax=Cryobacterium sp. M23 TaxID=2048292 RepID=UPI001E2A53AB|nr:HlyD family secretion protein [Cryobacterium sp. M23]
MPPLEIFFDLQPMNISTTVVTWLLYYAGFYLMQVMLAFYTMGSFRWETLMLATASFPIYVAALINVLVGKEQHWSATGDKSRVRSPFDFMIPQVLFFVFLLLTSMVAIWRDVGIGTLTLATAWNVTNTLILGTFVVTALFESRRARQARSRRRMSGAAIGTRRPTRILPARTDPRGGARMTWANRFKLFFGLIMVVGIVAVLTLIFNQRQAQVMSVSASIQAAEYPVGSDYGGTVLDRLVDDGDQVTAGQPLFTLHSPTLLADLAEGLVTADTVAYSVADDGVLTLTASVDGTVTDISTERGSFVQAGQVLAVIDKTGSLFVSADYVLTSGDYARIEPGAAVDIVLPNQTRMAGTMEALDVQTTDGQAETTAKVLSPDLVDGASNGLIAPGTPVTATIALRDDGPLAGASDGLFNFLQTIGL